VVRRDGAPARHEAVDLDRMGALDMNFFRFFVIDLEVLALSDLVSAADIHLPQEPVVSC
jgi:hypothetical protein